MVAKYYGVNKLIHADRRRSRAGSAWQRSFACDQLRPLIICRGPVRKEAMEIFEEMGMDGVGILLSDKDSIIYEQALAPELRLLRDGRRVHRVADYGGASGEERRQRIASIIDIAKSGGYCSVFAGYGFMAEDVELVAALEEAGLRFIGPGSTVVREAGSKDRAKRLAVDSGVSITPGVDNIAALTLLRRFRNRKALSQLADSLGLPVPEPAAAVSDEILAEQLLLAARARNRELFSIEELGAEACRQAETLFRRWPGQRLRLKAADGGGGKGQRILAAPDSYEGDPKQRLHSALADLPSLVREALSEVKATGPGDNRNILLEQNIEDSRHLEIQVVGNGDWCVTLGGRDCSLQMHEQKLLELSVTDAGLQREIELAQAAGRSSEAKALTTERRLLERVEADAARFGIAAGLNSVSTFECILTGRDYYFMEMNTRIQVEHRVTELCYGLRFTNPEDSDDSFEVHSLLELMVLLAAHGPRLPKPQLVAREGSAVEVRLNATNDALIPHAGGLVTRWSSLQPGEIRDDQGICLPNPDTGAFMRYRLAGAYDSNIALLLVTGEDRGDNLRKMAEILRSMELEGEDLATNLNFHRGLISWLLANSANARPGTRFVEQYLTAVGALVQQAGQLDLSLAWRLLAEHSIGTVSSAEDRSALKQVLATKEVLLLRPLEILLGNPHLLAGWLAHSRDYYRWNGDQPDFAGNPLQLIADLYHYLAMDPLPGRAAADCIWLHDQALLDTGLDFYRRLSEQLNRDDFPSLCKRLESGRRPAAIPAMRWRQVQAAHRGFQAGKRILLLLPALARASGLDTLKLKAGLREQVPQALREPSLQQAMRDVLAPPPVAGGDQIVAESGGMYYAREAPGLPPLIEAGQRFEVNQALCVIEVMKMFNRQRAKFAGTIQKLLIADDGVVVRKGQPLFEVSPDDPQSCAEDQNQRRELVRQYTEKLISTSIAVTSAVS